MRAIDHIEGLWTLEFGYGVCRCPGKKLSKSRTFRKSGNDIHWRLFWHTSVLFFSYREIAQDPRYRCLILSKSGSSIPTTLLAATRKQQPWVVSAYPMYTLQSSHPGCLRLGAAVAVVMVGRIGQPGKQLLLPSRCCARTHLRTYMRAHRTFIRGFCPGIIRPLSRGLESSSLSLIGKAGNTSRCRRRTLLSWGPGFGFFSKNVYAC